MTQTQNKQEGSFSMQVGVVPGESRPEESRGILKFELPVPREKFLAFPGEFRDFCHTAN